MLPLITAKHTNFKNVRIVGDDDVFGGVKMEEVLAGRRRVNDVFDVLKCEEGGMGNVGQNGKSRKNKLKSENSTFSNSIKLVSEHMTSFLPCVQDNTTCRATAQHG